jgi:hypothetical protein
MDARIAVVSANAFDKGLDNDAGVRPEDFILKPVRHPELLEWLGRQLGLRWLESPSAPAASTPLAPAAWVWPDAGALQALQQAVQLGYYRGILNQLDEIEAGQAECGPFAAAMRELASQFQFEAMSRELAKAPLMEVKQ